MTDATLKRYCLLYAKSIGWSIVGLAAIGLTCQITMLIIDQPPAWLTDIGDHVLPWIAVPAFLGAWGIGVVLAVILFNRLHDAIRLHLRLLIIGFAMNPVFAAITIAYVATRYLPDDREPDSQTT